MRHDGDRLENLFLLNCIPLSIRWNYKQSKAIFVSKEIPSKASAILFWAENQRGNLRTRTERGHVLITFQLSSKSLNASSKITSIEAHSFTELFLTLLSLKHTNDVEIQDEWGGISRPAHASNH